MSNKLTCVQNTKVERLAEAIEDLMLQIKVLKSVEEVTGARQELRNAIAELLK